MIYDNLEGEMMEAQSICKAFPIWIFTLLLMEGNQDALRQHLQFPSSSGFLQSKERFCNITGKIVDFDAVKLGDGDFNGIPIGITKDDLSVLQFP